MIIIVWAKNRLLLPFLKSLKDHRRPQFLFSFTASGFTLDSITNLQGLGGDRRWEATGGEIRCLVSLICTKIPENGEPKCMILINVSPKEANQQH